MQCVFPPAAARSVCRGDQKYCARRCCDKNKLHLNQRFFIRCYLFLSQHGVQKYHPRENCEEASQQLPPQRATTRHRRPESTTTTTRCRASPCSDSQPAPQAFSDRRSAHFHRPSFPSTVPSMQHCAAPHLLQKHYCTHYQSFRRDESFSG